MEVVDEVLHTGGRDMQSDWPVLDSMGVMRHHEITHYTHRSLDERSDVLRVFYKRTKGSLLPVSRKYVFGRATQAVVADSGSGLLQESLEISPTLLAAISELEQLMGNIPNSRVRDAQEIARTAALAELDKLHDAVLGIACDEDAEALDERFASLRAHIDGL